MDYLAFGLLSGSLIVIASFVVRDGLPHLSAIRDGSRLARLGRAEAPSAWARWCADAGLVLAAAGTLVLLITAATLLAGPSDGAGNLVVGASVVVAVVASGLGAARLARRLRLDAEAERSGDLAFPAPREAMTTPGARWVSSPAGPASSGAVVIEAAATAAPTPPVAPPDLWDDELPTWSPSAPAAASLGEGTDDERVPLLASPEIDARGERAAARINLPEPESQPEFRQVAPVTGGIFSSPLLADIGPSPVDDEDGDGFRSPLLSGLLEAADADEAEVGLGSDLLIDEAPAPVGGRHRDGVNDR